MNFDACSKQRDVQYEIFQYLVGASVCRSIKLFKAVVILFLCLVLSLGSYAAERVASLIETIVFCVSWWSCTWINIYFKLKCGVLFWQRDFKSS